MNIDLKETHILRGKCFETDSTIIQILLVWDKTRDIFSALKVIGGDLMESSSGNPREACEKTYNGWEKFYHGNKE